MKMTEMHTNDSLWIILVAVVSGLVFFYGIYSTCRVFIQGKSPELGLSRVSVVRISARTVSGIQGMLACVAGVVITSSCQDVINDSHWVAEAYAWFLCTYLYFDTWLGFQEYVLSKDEEKERGSKWRHLVEYLCADPGMTIHHVLLPLFILPMISLVRRGAFFFGCFLFAEAVLPFKAYRDIAVELGRQRTKVYLVNAVLFVLTFIASRFLIYLYMWKGYADQLGVPVLSVPATIPIQCNLGCLAYVILNVYFMTKIVRQVRIEGLEWFNGAKIKSE